FMTNEKAMTSVFEYLAHEGLFLVENNPASGTSLAPQNAAQATQAIFLGGGVVVDAILTEKDIQAKLRMAETQALTMGSAIAIATPAPVSIDLISKWIQTLGKRGLQIVHTSALAENKKPPTPQHDAGNT